MSSDHDTLQDIMKDCTTTCYITGIQGKTHLDDPSGRAIFCFPERGDAIKFSQLINRIRPSKKESPVLWELRQDILKCVGKADMENVILEAIGDAPEAEEYWVNFYFPKSTDCNDMRVRMKWLKGGKL